MLIHRRLKKKSPLHDAPLRYPGQSIDIEIDRIFVDEIVQGFLIAFGFLVFAVMDWISFFTKSKLNPIIVTIFLLIAIIYSTIRIMNARRKMKLLKLGRAGERIVAEILDDLKKEGDAIFHDVVGDKFNIDHVVLSRHGIFAIETKTISKYGNDGDRIFYDGKKVLVNGREPDRDPVQQIISLSSWLSEEIRKTTGKTFSVRPTIVYPGWFVEPMPAHSHVWVLNPKALPKFIKNEPEIMECAPKIEIIL